MPVNPGIEYKLAEKAYLEAETIQEKLKTSQEMLQKVPKHKSSENLIKEIKQRISKFKAVLEKERQQKKSSGRKSSIKKEGAACIVIIGKTNSGKSYLLSKLTNAKPEIAEYEFTTKKPEIGIMDYEGVKVQIIEIPAIIEDFLEKENGPMLLGIVRNADLVIMLVKNKGDEVFLKKELNFAGIKFDGFIIKSGEVEGVKEKIWKRLGLIYAFTKQPGKKKDFPPVALKKGSTVKDIAGKVHRDFIKRFKFARIFGPSAKFYSQRFGLDHVLKEGDVVELHLK